MEKTTLSENFIATAKRIQAGEELQFKVPIEGDISEEVSVVHQPGVDAYVMKRVNFFRGDACALSVSDYADNKQGFGTFDGVIMANLLCRLPDPMKALNSLQLIVNKGGVVVIVTPFTWLESKFEVIRSSRFHFLCPLTLHCLFQEYTPRDKWLGGYPDHELGTSMYSKNRLKEIMEGIGFEHIHEEQMPLVIREHRRKYQYIVSEASGWRKK